MKQRNIYLVQVDTLRKFPTHTTIYLPYATGVLWAYARQSALVQDTYALADLLFMRDSIDDVVSRMDAPFLVGFSSYIWSTEYNKALAEAVKRAFPACKILFGGHNVPPGGEMLEEFPYIDYLLHGEGEIPFQTLLEELAKDTPDVSAVPGLSYRTDGGTATNAETALASVENSPSPYLEGLFDPIVAAHPDIYWSAVWETNRGCPHHCAYCDWGQHNAAVRQFSMERLLAEIQWMSEHRVSFVYGADANFGILPRDEELLNQLAEARTRTGFPRMFDVNTVKAINERMFRITKKFNESGLDKTGMSLAVQSLSTEVLHNIGRKNIDDETLGYWIRRCRQEGWRTHTDLILGLPGETLQSFCAGVERLYALGQHEGIRYFPLALLPNTLLATPAFREKYQFRITRRINNQTMEVSKESIPEYIDTVIETSTMTQADFMTAFYFMFLTGGAHSFGLTRLLAMYFHVEKIVPYADFYMSLLHFCHEHPRMRLGETMARTEKNFDDLANGEEPEPLEIPGFSFGRMGEDQYFLARAVLEPERFYDDIAAFLQQFHLEPALFAQLLRYQREAVLMPNAQEKTLSFEYDFPAYFEAIYNGSPAPLEKKAVRLQFSFDGDVSTAQKYFHTIIQLGRFSNKTFYQTTYVPEGSASE